MRTPVTPRIAAHPVALAAIAYGVITLVLFRSLLPHIASGFPHDPGDPVLSAWALWWNAHHLPFVGSWWDGVAFYPEHGSLAFSDHRVGLGLIACVDESAEADRARAVAEALCATLSVGSREISASGPVRERQVGARLFPTERAKRTAFRAGGARRLDLIQRRVPSQPRRIRDETGRRSAEPIIWRGAPSFSKR